MKPSTFKLRRSLSGILGWAGTVLMVLALISLLGLCYSSVRENIEMLGQTVMAFTSCLSGGVAVTMIADIINPS